MKKVAVFGDLTALYTARTELKKNINYLLVDKAIKEKFGVKTLSCSKWYTLFHPQNQPQVDFVKMLETDLNWEVITKRPSEVRRSSANSNPHNDYRFDAQIAYNIGGATGEDYDTIVVVSDSIELLKPLKDAVEFFDGKIYIAFFGDAMDRRWWNGLNNSRVEFLELGSMIHSTQPSRPEIQESERFE